MGTVSCTAFVLSHRTGWPPEVQDISWPSSPIRPVSCTAVVQSHRRSRGTSRRREGGRKEGRKEEGRDRGKSYNLHTVGGEKYKLMFFACFSNIFYVSFT